MMVVTVLGVLALACLLPASEPSTVDRLVSRIDALEAKGGPSIFVRHLRSLRAVVQTEAARIGLARLTNPKEGEATDGYFADMERGLAADAGEWETYLEGRRSLIMAYVSPYDQSVQWYALTLPKDWDPAKSYPLFLELHGAGDPHPLGWPAGQVGLPAGVAPADYKTPKMYPMIARDGYHVFPFCRGNLGYRGVAERDVWDALADVERLVKIDPDRRHLFGFSMGGGGTWSLGSRTPDLWASMAIFAGALRDPAGRGIGRNLASMPVWIWCGETDSLFPHVARMERELTEAGNPPVVTTVPGLGHNYTGESQRAAYEWSLPKVRRRPAKFAFVADTDDHLGVWGVRLRRDLAVSPLPRFEVEVAGSKVSVTSQGTAGLTVELGEAGLGLTGEVELVWNGKPAYKGPAISVDLGEGAGARPRR